VCKNQKISLHFSRVSSPHPSTAKRKKKWKGNFWFCFAVSVSEKSNLILTFLFALFSTLTATEARPSPRLVVTLKSVASFTGGGKSRRRSLAIQNSLRNGEAQICMCLPQTLPCARSHPRRFEEQYKTAGMAPGEKINLRNTMQEPLSSLARQHHNLL
jgi:hypothetical protein